MSNALNRSMMEDYPETAEVAQQVKQTLIDW